MTESDTKSIDGLSYEDIAEVMDCPVGTVRSRIFRAREAIDRQVKAQMDGLTEGGARSAE